MDPLDLLPHRPPMRLVDEIVELVPGQHASARRVLRGTDFFFDGHFPGEPIVPAVILVELLAQVGGLAAGAPASGSSPPGVQPLRLRLAGIGSCKFPSAARPGSVLDVHARVTGKLGSLFKIEGEVLADGAVVATGSVTLASVS